MKTLVLMPSFKTVNYLNILQEVVPEMLNAKPGHLAARRWESATHYTFLNGYHHKFMYKNNLFYLYYPCFM